MTMLINSSTATKVKVFYFLLGVISTLAVLIILGLHVHLQYQFNVG